MVRPHTMPWSVGDYLTHRYNPELGIGRIVAVEGRVIVVEFGQPQPTAGPHHLHHGHGGSPTPPAQAAGPRLRLAANTDALVRVVPGTTIAPHESGLLERLASGSVDEAEDFLIRLEVLQLLAVREADGLGSFLGGRVRLFPHQLYVAERATLVRPVRWLLADEVGLGKTIEACLILNHLVHTGGIERCLVVAPEPLTVQWLGELWRKYHQVFTLLDAPRLADVARDFGRDFNPFDVHRRAVIAVETLIERPELTMQATAAGIDLLVVDEAQRLRRSPGHPGTPAWRAVAPVAALGRHVLLLSATPLEDDAHGFLRLLQLLRPGDFPEELSFDERLARGLPLPPCTSATRRADIGGLPPRVGLRVEGSANAWNAQLDVEQQMRAAPATNDVVRRRKIDRIRRAASSGAALAAVLGHDEQELRSHVQAMDARDPRIEWLAAQATRWRDAGEKTLVFVAHRETLEMLRTALSHRAQLATAVFHEELSTPRRDTEVARFREAGGPSLLISTECGGEGRNFEFCRRLVLFDLPWQPSVVEQRIGRLDRIGRRTPVEIVYFQPPGGIGAAAVRLLEAAGVFREPLAGIEPQLAGLERALERVAADPAGSLSAGAVEQLLQEAGAARTRIQEAAYQQLHRDPYRADMARQILARVPPDLDGLVEHAVERACTRLGFRVEHVRGQRTYAIEFGNEALVDGLPGVPGGSSFVGTFNREEAVADESIDFFASGHALVEGVIAHYVDGLQGRVARIELAAAGDPGTGVIVIYRDELGYDIVAVDQHGQPRPEWVEAIRRRPPRARRMPDAVAHAVDSASIVERLKPHLDSQRRPHAVAAVVIDPQR